MLIEQPRKGQRVTFPSGHAGEVLRVEDNLCWVKWDDGTSDPFIWRFRDGLNKLATLAGRAGESDGHSTNAKGAAVSSPPPAANLYPK